MKIKKTIALMSAISLLLAFSSCNTAPTEETTYGYVSDTSQNEVTDESGFTEATNSLQETTSEISLTEEKTTPAVENTTAAEETTEEEATTAIENETAKASDVSEWDTEKALAFYKDAAEKTGDSVKSRQVIALSDISVNNGQLSGMFKYVTPMLSRFLSGSATETDGITGEYKLLASSDIASSKAYSAANGTVLEFTLNPQTDKADSESRDGSVAHGISVVGDLGSIMGKLKEFGLPIEISLDKAVLSYSEPHIRVLVDENGKIINGTWEYTVEISLSDYTFAGAKVDSTVVVLENTITVNGGFSE